MKRALRVGAILALAVWSPLAAQEVEAPEGRPGVTRPAEDGKPGVTRPAAQPDRRHGGHGGGSAAPT